MILKVERATFSLPVQRFHWGAPDRFSLCSYPDLRFLPQRAVITVSQPNLILLSRFMIGNVDLLGGAAQTDAFQFCIDKHERLPVISPIDSTMAAEIEGEYTGLVPEEATVGAEWLLIVSLLGPCGSSLNF